MVEKDSKWNWLPIILFLLAIFVILYVIDNRLLEILLILRSMNN